MSKCDTGNDDEQKSKIGDTGQPIVKRSESGALTMAMAMAKTTHYSSHDALVMQPCNLKRESLAGLKAGYERLDAWPKSMPTLKATAKGAAAAAAKPWRRQLVDAHKR